MEELRMRKGNKALMRARDIVMVATMSALVVVVHLFFHVTVPLQAGTAMVILSGMALGPKKGFAIGALSRFVCNFYMLQGMWTPWQMLCWGLLGMLAGIFFEQSTRRAKSGRQNFKLPDRPAVMAAFSFFVTFIVYGGIINIAAMFLTASFPGEPAVSLKTLQLTYISGIPYDLFHAVCAAAFVFLFGTGFTKRLSRIAIKYGVN